MSSQSVSQLTQSAPASVAIAGTSRPRSIAGMLQDDHSPALSVALHLLPGALTGVAYLLLRQPVIALGFPSAMALYFAIPLALVPSSFGLLLYLGYQQHGHLTLQGVVRNRERISLRTYMLYVPLVFATSVIVVVVGQSVVDAGLQKTLFVWMPTADYGLVGGYAKPVLIVAYALMAISLSLEVAAEELYFRGFLLPRMRYSGCWTTPVHSFLYALYHLWIPWRLVSLAVGMLPLVWAVRRTRNLYIGVIAHALLDSFYIIFGVSFILTR